MERRRLRLVVSRRPWTCSIFLVCTFLGAAACDPVFDYRPAGWEESGGKWVWRGRSFDLRMSGPSGIISSERLVPEMAVHNRGEAAVGFQRCTPTPKGRRDNF